MALEVYDKIWIMRNNEPVEMLVYAIVEEMAHMKRGTEIYYLLVPERCGASFDSGLRRHAGEIYLSRQDVIDHI